MFVIGYFKMYLNSINVYLLSAYYVLETARDCEHMQMGH